ncbi:MAG: hypothetical protein WHU93_01220 [Arcobacteraceae bacterium]
MISISKNKLYKITKMGLGVLAVYTVGFLTVKTIAFIKYYYEKEKLTLEIKEKQERSVEMIQKIDNMKAKLDNIQKAYISQEELEQKLKGIFSRLSLSDYKLRFVTSTKLCVDRYAIMVELNATTSNGLKAGEGILSYLGKITKSKDKENIYFVDYIMKAGDK